MEVSLGSLADSFVKSCGEKSCVSSRAFAYRGVNKLSASALQAFIVPWLTVLQASVPSTGKLDRND
jgi:hypothetical protein